MSKTPLKSSQRGVRKTPSPVVTASSNSNSRKSPVRMSAKAPAPGQGIPQRRPQSGSKLLNSRNKSRGDVSPTDHDDEFLSQSARFVTEESDRGNILQRSDRDDLKAFVDQQKKDLADLRRSPGSIRGPVPAIGRNRSGAVPTPSNMKAQHSSTDNMDVGAPPDHLSDTTEVEKYMGSESLFSDFKKLVTQMNEIELEMAYQHLDDIVNRPYLEGGSRRANGTSKIAHIQRSAAPSKVVQGNSTDFSFYSDSDLDENDELATHDKFIITAGGYHESVSSSRTPTPNHTHKRSPTPDRVPCPSTERSGDVIIRPVVNPIVFADINGGRRIRPDISDELSVCSSSNSSFTAVTNKGVVFVEM